MKHRFIVVEGPIGSGKSTLARLLAERFGAELLLEDPSANPFLPNFYRDMKRYALSTQMFFLFQRVNQLSGIKQPDLFEGKSIADYMLAKDTLFAKLTLDDNEFALYSQLYNHLRPQAPTPDLVIYLQASVDQLMQRIGRRGRPMERSISEDYLVKLSDAYTRFFYDYTESPLLIVNSDRFNFVDRQEDLDLLIKRVESLRGGKEYMNAA
ncbi:MAG: deoxynucleoside kinase [Rhodocyclaceae bacterium]|jgi:deoxyadenosine/deoxycytidine kinase|nr:deoxynucleoside kinase [Rhodocyclaceae bacterium]MCA3024864.1 deoxynucleoside kinase [Rhodocyclaceae bacterium]MCA3028418.1 deoxynucleoside kinase [Rhodocyclaceae bacterium]MCA3032310.1 deoxynucleoside kinase [Rhodocyclaceae bacterium]MCA3034767.1 deoxynucleoside kinase [Rhodocyclaceae bacterium]